MFSMNPIKKASNGVLGEMSDKSVENLKKKISWRISEEIYQELLKDLIKKSLKKFQEEIEDFQKNSRGISG